MRQNQNDDIISRLYSIADELQAVANLGLQYSRNEYDRERYEKVLMASIRLVSILDDKPLSSIENKFRDNYGHISPLVGAEAAVFREGQLLLIKHHDDGLWAVPGGMVEVGETLTNAVLRELREETGLAGIVTGLLGVFDSRTWKSQLKSQLYHVIFEVTVPQENPVVTKEATDWGFFSADKLPALSPGHSKRVPVLFKLMNGEIKPPYFDAPDNLPANTIQE
jgi:ADP-ribose pyrophosphatase YjhB (NUDIX family)